MLGRVLLRSTRTKRRWYRGSERNDGDTTNPSYDRTSISCDCGDVNIEFSVQRPLYSLECCCVDCYQKLHASKGKMPHDHGTGDPLKLSYFPNNLNVKAGSDKIEFNKLRSDANSTNMITTCCNTIMCVDHPSYNKKQVLTFPDYVTFRPANACEESTPVARVWIRDWPEEALKALRTKKPLPEHYFDYETNTYSRDSKKAVEAIARGKGRVRSHDLEGGTTFQDILESKENRIKILDLPEMAHSHRKNR